MSAAASTPAITAEPPALPAGEYAIVEVLGHRTFIGRIGEVERFGVKLLAVEPLFNDMLLPPVFIGGASIYQLSPVPAEVAARRQPRYQYQLPDSVSAALPPAADEEDRRSEVDDDDVDFFAPEFLSEEVRRG